ncbi:BREX-1 system adenine-specific DNA-methyltransferase PglX [Metallumcola ferriviriculae]|uniref:site-specific DNA-methyltransferase (adenine-specific) n=1 Tax=Metallumcola ferriviriculae TaxID=3039180 RepID=A0AAU0UMX9_9FIRM|nr:BREX-1 system adenine-specific DNA-methyltransferase PglX [Desulfitibacteraceae bacterium MK1]
MNKTAIKSFAIWARNKLIADITYKAGLLGITEKEIKNSLPQSTETVQFFDIGTKEPYSISGVEIEQRKKLIEEVQRKANQSDYKTAYKSVVEEVAYTWFNRLIAIRFMEVNNYLPTRMRVLSSESSNKAEPDLVTHPMDVDFDYTPYEKDRIMQLKHDNKLDELFRMLFIKQCNALNAILPELFEKTSDYTELLLNVSFTDQDGVVYHLVNDILEDDFNVSKKGQVEIIGWMYQYYNTEPKDETFALLKKNVKITKERIPAATQLFTPDWIVRYMVENSLGRLWLEGHPNDTLKSEWKYYLDEAEQEADVQKQLDEIREEYKKIKPEDITVIDPCMGSGHILVYAFDVLIKIYESYGYSQRDAAKSIIENNLFGLDIDNRAYQLAYFAVMMKARQYNRRILNGKTTCYVYSIQESNSINRSQLNYFGSGISEMKKNTAMLQMHGLLDNFIDAKEYGSILNVDNYDWQLLHQFIENIDASGQMTMDNIGIDITKERLRLLVEIGEVMDQKYDVVVTNPPYMGSKGLNGKLTSYIQDHFAVGKGDIYAAFLLKCIKWAKPAALLAFITPYVWLYLSSFMGLRRNLISDSSLMSLVQLEYNAFEVACVPVCTFTMRKTKLDYTGRYIQLAQFKGWENQEIQTLKAINDFSLDYCYETRQSNFEKIAGSPIAYWLSKSMYAVFENARPLKDFGYPRQGMATADNGRFMRKWYEVAVTNIDFNCRGNEYTYKKWYPHSKGGSVRRWYGNNEYIINWKNNGMEIRDYRKAVVRNPDYYFRQGITWSDLTISWFSARYVPDGFTFDSAGPTFFPHFEEDIKYICGYFNSWVFQEFLNISCQGMHYSNGIIAELPIIVCDNNYDKQQIETIVDKCIEISKKDWDEDEKSWDFKKDVLISNDRDNNVFISKLLLKYKKEKLKLIHVISANENKINELFAGIFKMDDITPSKGICSTAIQLKNEKSLIVNLISYAVGCMFGRYSLDVDGLIYAGGKWDGSKYNTFIPDKDNIIPITDEEYFEDDVVGLFCAFLKKTFGTDTLEENLDFIAKALGNKGNSSREIIRNYFLKGFFKDHCKIYQKRPIYWMFDSGKADGFKALVYMHRYNENTIGNLRIDYLHRMQRSYDNEISRMQETIENSKDAREATAASKRKEKLLKQLKETKEYDEKIAHLALARIAIDLDDGVKVNYEKVQTDTDGKKLEVLAKI